MNIYPTSFFPPIPLFAALYKEKEAMIEIHEHFRKQKLTNRMQIKISNRIMPLTIPLVRTPQNTPIKDKKIANHEKWQRHHWITIGSAYRSSPYFEYYEDKLAPFFSKNYEYMVDLNEAVLEMLFGVLDMEINIQHSESYEPPETYTKDYRNVFDPKGETQPDWFKAVPYTQVFESFTPGLSILDLICNEGPRSRMLLAQSVDDGFF